MKPRPNHAHGNLVRGVLRAEKGLRGYIPTPRPDPPEPEDADEVLAALAAAYRPGDAVGTQQILERIAVTRERARAVVRWAQSVGAWPYLRPGPFRPAGGQSDRPAPRRKGGGPCR
jgi:hypothetical protein